MADEMGVLVWMEYPTWHSQWTPDQLPKLRKEFDEFFCYDRNHPSVILRVRGQAFPHLSLTSTSLQMVLQAISAPLPSAPRVL
jgi:hypothetical protein